MGLLDKIKDLFLDDVIEDEEDEEDFPEVKKKEDKKLKREKEEIEEVKEKSKPVLPKVMRETIKEEEKREEKVLKEEKREKITPADFVNFNQKKEEPLKEEKRFNFPIDFDTDLPSRNSKNVSKDRNSNINVLDVERDVSKKVSDMYSKKEEVKEKPRFKASPVISPVYGVLDKNYTKEEVKERSEDEQSLMKRPSKKVDFETVRKKAFGNLADEIKDNLNCENCELYKEVKKISALTEDDLFYDMTVDEKKDVTIEKAYDDYESFGVAYEPRREKEEKVEEVKTDDEPVKDEREDLVINNNVVSSEEEIKEKPQLMVDKIDEDEVVENKEDVNNDEIEEVPTRESKKKEMKVDSDFFELIDSMYKERSDD